jgi:hypothetical protein
MPWVRWPPWARDRPRILSPGVIMADSAAALACAPECGWTLAYSAPKSCLDPVDGQLLGDVDVFAAAVVAAARVTLGVLVGEDGALGLHHGAGGEVFGGNHFQGAALAAELLVQDCCDFGIELSQRLVADGDG